MEKVNIENIQAIYVNPRWKKSKVGDFLTYNKKKKKSKVPQGPEK